MAGRRVSFKGVVDDVVMGDGSELVAGIVGFVLQPDANIAMIDRTTPKAHIPLNTRSAVLVILI